MCCTMSNGTGKSLGSPERIVCRTGGPPVEAPMPISLMLRAATGELAASFGCGTAGSARDRFQRRTTLTSDISRTVCRRFSSSGW